ncbi:PQQ-binding-like beta-propeller repeat protein [candidate division WOR-3 bacterium]|uniref:PQQ-binding-like beta-propeller repeat protein n=1 Tax=candidate division WOR-3 bacterium TaxID=2052148 RepID=A0A9D5KDA0_UNCW3|nr:PQQ-binding-like beta-propeller repeat protein [candidate division WOR-3 bacterium]MBD3365481.1 PQQ-binding-like beta-propeller repeat protein [candidate division WOR-3 bacterium]
MKSVPKMRWFRLSMLMLLQAVIMVGAGDELDVYDDIQQNPSQVQIQGTAIPLEQNQILDIGSGSESLEESPDLPHESFTVKDGRKGWKVKVQRPLPLPTPAVSDGKVYIGGGFGSYEFYALDAETGKPLWLFHCGDDGPTAAVIEDDCVAFNTESCILYVLDKKTGKKLWGKWLGDPLMSQPAIQGGKIVMAYPNQKGGHSLACMGLKDGKVFWAADIPGEVISTPVIADGKTYASTLEGSVHCYALDSGEKLFSREHQATSAPWVWQGEIYVSLREDEERMVNGEKIVVRTEGQGRITHSGDRDNEILWAKQDADYLNIENSSRYAAEQKELDASVGFASAPAAAKLAQSEVNLGIASVSGVWAYQGSRPTIIEGISYSSMGDTLKALDAASGKVLWKRFIEIKNSPGGRPFSPPSYASGKLYLGAVSGEIICLDAKDGKELWRYDCGEPVRFQPAVVDGKVYWGTDAGTIFCLEAKDPKATGWAMWGGNAQHNY